MDDLKTIGARIRQARTSKGLTQADLAAAVGVTRAHITKVEGGNDALALDKLAILASETGTTVGWLIGETTQEEPPDPQRARLLAVYDALSEERRQIAVKVIEALEARDTASVVVTGEPEPPPPPQDRPDIPRRSAKGADPTRPFSGGNVARNGAEPDCAGGRDGGGVVRIYRAPSAAAPKGR